MHFFRQLSTESKIHVLTSVVLLVGLFLNLGLQPFYLEEPRRVLITMEMLENNNWTLPTQLGEYYYNKPPGFNWVLIGSTSLFGELNEWSARFPTVLSTILLSVLIFLLNWRYLNRRAAWLGAILFTSSAGILFYFSTLAEIDLYYSLLTFASIAAIFHFHKVQRYFPLFLIIYGLSALGFLTKGLPSLVFIAISLLVFFTYQRQWYRLFSLAHFSGILLFAAIIGTYFWHYAQHNSVQQFITVLWGQSSERTVIDQGFFDLFGHVLAFPFQTIGDIMPGGLLLLFAIRKDFWKLIRQNDWITFCCWMFGVNFILYWLSPGAKLRYIYMLYPFLLNVLLYLYLQRSSLRPWRMQLFRGILQSLLGIMAIAAAIIPLIEDLAFLNYLLPLAAIGFLLFMALFIIGWRRKALLLPVFLLAVAIARIFFDLTVLPQRAYDSGGQRGKDIAAEIVDIVEDKPLHIWQDGRFSFTIVAYINQLRGQTIRRNYQRERDAFYIANDTLLTNPHESFYELQYHESTLQLVKWKE